MLLIDCPHCGARAQTEFDYARTLDAIIPIDSTPDAAMMILYQRTNPRGVDDELWRHTQGCRQFVALRRHRVTHVILGVTAWGAS